MRILWGEITVWGYSPFSIPFRGKRYGLVLFDVAGEQHWFFGRFNSAP